MNRSPIIQRILSLIMIVVMAFTITPLRTVHEIFGCHENSVVSTHQHSQSESSFDKDGFHCACESQHFLSPFIEQFQACFNIPSFNIAGITVTPVQKDLPHSEQTTVYLRGPPSLV